MTNKNLQLQSFPKLPEDLRTFWSRREGQLTTFIVLIALFFIVFNWTMVSSAIISFIGRLVWGTIQFIVTIITISAIIGYLISPTFRLLINGWLSAILRIAVIKSPTRVLKDLFSAAVEYDEKKLTTANNNEQILENYIISCKEERENVKKELDQVAEEVKDNSILENERIKKQIKGTHLLAMLKNYDKAIEENKDYQNRFKKIIDICGIRLEENKGLLAVEIQNLSLQEARKSIVSTLLPMFNTSGFRFLSDESLSIARAKFAKDEQSIVAGISLIEPITQNYEADNKKISADFLNDYTNYTK